MKWIPKINLQTNVNKTSTWFKAIFNHSQSTKMCKRATTRDQNFRIINLTQTGSRRISPETMIKVRILAIITGPIQTYSISSSPRWPLVTQTKWCLPPNRNRASTKTTTWTNSRLTIPNPMSEIRYIKSKKEWSILSVLLDLGAEGATLIPPRLHSKLGQSRNCKTWRTHRNLCHLDLLTKT